MDDDVWNYSYLTEIGGSFGLFENTAEFHSYTSKCAFFS